MPKRSRLWDKIRLISVLIQAALIAPAARGQGAPVDPLDYLRRPVVEAEVTRGSDGNLTIHWPLDANAVTIYAGKRPGEIRHGHPIARVTGQNEFALHAATPTDRTYFELHFTGGPDNGKTLTVAERFVPLKGAVNFRDVGGYRTTDGHHVRWGLVYRSEGLAKLTDSDLSYLADDLRLHLVCDLRGQPEITAAPDRLPTQRRPETVHLPIEANGLNRQIMTVLLRGDAGEIDNVLAQGYIDMVDARAADVFGPFLARLANRKNLPTVVHCTAGKDRTGIATALLLSLLGVPRETVIADYSLTNLTYDTLLAELRDNRALAATGIRPEKMGPLMVANPVWMERTLDHIEQKYGSVEDYLKTAAKLDDATLAGIRANLLY